MKTLGDATTLAKAMVQIGTELNRKTVALITNMNEPLGEYVGNSVEIKEVLTTLKGNGPEDLTTLCVELATHMLILAGKGSEEEIREKVKEKIKNGEALDKFMEFVKAQGGTLDIDGTNLKVASNTIKIKAGHKGYVKAIDTEAIGIATVLMGGGRLKKEDTIDYSVGLKINKKIGDYVDEDTDIAEIYTNKEDNEEIINKIQTAYNYSDELVKKSDIIYNIIK